MHDEGAPEDAEGGAPTAEPAAPLSMPERTAVLNGLPDDERGPAAAAVGALGGADADALVEVHHPSCVPRVLLDFVLTAQSVWVGARKRSSACNRGACSGGMQECSKRSRDLTVSWLREAHCYPNNAVQALAEAAGAVGLRRLEAVKDQSSGAVVAVS